jgi:phosphatidylglycerophosphate synthase
MDMTGTARTGGNGPWTGPAARLVLSGLALLAVPPLLAPVLVPGAGLPATAAGMTVLALAVAIAGAAMARAYPWALLGLCNLVTLFRAALAASLCMALAAALTGSDPAGWPVAAVAAVALALDGVDGWLARRSGLVSDFGARFDMEVDSLLAAVLALLALATGKAGLWVLALGLMRYGFVLAAMALPWLAAPLPQRLRRKAVCVIQIGALVVLLAPPVVPPLSVWIGGLAVAALVWSFALDILWLARRR